MELNTNSKENSNVVLANCNETDKHNKNCVFLAENDIEIEGYFSIVKAENDIWIDKVYIKKDSWLVNIYVKPQYFNTGINLTLFRNVKKYCLEKNILTCYSFTNWEVKEIKNDRYKFIGKTISNINQRVLFTYEVNF